MERGTAGLLQDMATVGLVGSGHIGSAVARLAVSAGHNVVLSNSRGPDTLQELAAELGDRARAATGSEAASAGDIVMVSVPLKAYPHLSGLPLAGKVVMDTGNYYPQRDGQIPELDTKSLTDSEYLLGHLPGSQVVKVFNNIFFKHLLNLARPSGAADRSAVPIAGNSKEAKAAVTEFLDSIDTGPSTQGCWQKVGASSPAPRCTPPRTGHSTTTRARLPAPKSSEPPLLRPRGSDPPVQDGWAHEPATSAGTDLRADIAGSDDEPEDLSQHLRDLVSRNVVHGADQHSKTSPSIAAWKGRPPRRGT